jgi:hypothetical protein
MNITIRFNIGMTLAVIGYVILISPLLLDDPTPMMVESFFPENILLQFITGVLSLVFGITAAVFIIRTLWNRLLPHLCGWKEITLAEAYAISLLVGMFLFE